MIMHVTIRNVILTKVIVKSKLKTVLLAVIILDLEIDNVIKNAMLNNVIMIMVIVIHLFKDVLILVTTHDLVTDTVMQHAIMKNVIMTMVIVIKNVINNVNNDKSVMVFVIMIVII